MGGNLTDRFIDDLYALGKADFPETVVHQAKRCLLDYLGATLAGAQMMREKGNKLLNEMGAASSEVAVIGFGEKANIQNAAFINGLSSHIAELDDGVRFGMIHPGSPVFSALLPIAEKKKVSASDLIRGIVIGYEAEVRLACAIQPSHYSRGYHPTGTCGTIGAALGLAAMLDYSKDEMKNTLSSAAVSASGTLKVLEDGSELKPLNVGHAALAGVLSAFMGRSGFKGPDDVFTGDTGFMAMMADTFDVNHLVLKKGDAFAVERGYVKPYAACRHAHPAIEAVLKIRAVKDLHANVIKEIRVITYKGVLGKHDHTTICGISSAKMSIPYALSVALVTGKAGIEEFTAEYVNNPEILALAGKVVVSANDKISALVPQQRAAIVEVVTCSGDRYSERVDYPKGEPENPLSNEELEEKFTLLALYGNKSRTEINGIIKAVWNLEKELSSLFRLL
jgi:2-methylcitrate dehydratase PrpD